MTELVVGAKSTFMPTGEIEARADGTWDGSGSGGSNVDFAMGAFTGKAGQAVLRYDIPTDQTRLLLDVDGDGNADGVILFAGDHRDFVNFAL